MSEHPDSELSAAELISAIQDRYGISRSQIAAQLARSPRMVSKIARGESSGASFLTALQELNDRGMVTNRPARRRSKDGRLVPVRVREDEQHQRRERPGGGTAAPVVVPEDTGGRYAAKVPSRYREQTAYGEDGRVYHDVQMKPGSLPSTERARTTFSQRMRSVTKSQSRKDKRVTFTVTLDNGREMELGGKSGYFSSDVQRRIRTEFGGDDWAFIQDQISKVPRYEEALKGRNLARVQMSVHNARGRAARSKKR